MAKTTVTCRDRDLAPLLRWGTAPTVWGLSTEHTPAQVADETYFLSVASRLQVHDLIYIQADRQAERPTVGLFVVRLIDTAARRVVLAPVQGLEVVKAGALSFLRLPPVDAPGDPPETGKGGAQEPPGK